MLRLESIIVSIVDSYLVANLDAERVRVGLKDALPSKRFSEPVFLADGFSSYVFLVGDMLLRVAKHSEAATQHAKEVRALPRLKQGISLQIPLPTWHLAPSKYFPFGAVGYRRIAGTPFDLSLAERVDLEQVAFSLATFLLELHRCTSLLSVPARGDEPALLWNATSPTLRHYLGARYKKAQAWWLSFAQYEDERPPMALVHGDLWGENIILDDSLSQVVGIVDFESLAVGDVAQDFAPQMYVSRKFLEMVAEYFERLGGQSGRDFERRVRDWSILRELRGLRYALVYPELDELEDSLEKVQKFW